MKSHAQSLQITLIVRRQITLALPMPDPTVVFPNFVHVATGY